MKISRRISKKSSILPVLVLTIAVLSYFGAHTYATRLKTVNSACKDICISILKNGFSKDEVSVKVGEYVQFNSLDGQQHNLALGSGLDEHMGTAKHLTEADGSSTSPTTSHDHTAGTESGIFGDGEAWRVQFKHAGTFIIHDHLHPEKTILVVAYNAVSKN